MAPIHFFALLVRQRRATYWVVISLISTAVFVHTHNVILLDQTKPSVTMANINVLEEQGSVKCLRFNDGTKPVCHVEGQLGHLCQPCSHQDQAARALFDNGTPQARHELLQREHQNLRLAHVFTTAEHQAEASATEAWRIAVAAKTAERDTLLRHRGPTE